MAEIRVRFNAVTADECCRAVEHGLIRGIATNGGEQRKLLQCVGKRSRGCGRMIGGNPLAFQGAGFRRSHYRRELCLSRKIGGDPVADAALERHRAVAETNELGRNMRAGQLVRIRIVHDDFAIAGKRRRAGGVADRAGQPDRAVFVGILQPRIDDDRRCTALEALFEIFFADAGNGHGLVL